MAATWQAAPPCDLRLPSDRLVSVPKMTVQLTNRQQEIVAYVAGYHAAHHCSPSFRELSAHLGVRLQAVTNHMKAIVKKGALVQILSADGRHRGWRVP